MENLAEQLDLIPADFRPVPFWSWNDALVPEKLIEQIRRMKEQGIGGFFIHARSGLKTPYLSDEWMRCVSVCADEAERLGMKTWIYDDSGWPSGFVGGKLLKNPAFRAHYLTCSAGAFDEKATVSYRTDRRALVRVTADCGAAEYLNVYEHVSRSNVDILNPEVVGTFLRETHERYKAYFGEKFSEKIAGFFTDEPQYYRWKTPYTGMIAEAFRRDYGEDILDGIGLLFVKKEGWRSFRYRYWLGLQRLMLRNYAERLYGWCAENGVRLTGHYVEENSIGWQIMCCGGVMPFYEYEHIPGIDLLGRDISNELPARQLGSAAAQLGKKQTLTESFACCGWDVTPAQLKTIGESQAVFGVNLLCQHLIPYSDRGRRRNDYPAHFSEINPWIASGFRPFNDYFSRLGKLLSESSESVDTAMLHPLRSGYFEYQRERETDGFGIAALDRRFREQQKQIARQGIPFHLLDETLLEKYGAVRGDRLCCGKCTYRYLILPTCCTIGEKTAALFRQFTENGGKLLLLDRAPKYLGWEKHDFSFLKSTVTAAEIAAAQPCRAVSPCASVRFTSRRLGGREFLFVCNLSAAETAEVTLLHPSGASGWERFLPENGTSVRSAGRLTLPPGGSALLFCTGGAPEQEQKPEKTTLTLSGPFRPETPQENYLPLDFAAYSADGTHFTEKMPCAAIFDALLASRYRGELTLRYTFFVRDIPAGVRLRLEQNGIHEITVNGQPGELHADARDEAYPYWMPLSGLKHGENEIRLRFFYFQQDTVYDILHSDSASTSLKNGISYDTEICPVCLSGTFGVFPAGGYRPGRQPETLLGDGFEICAPQSGSGELVRDGYPFFAGAITLRGSFSVGEKPDFLRLTGHYLSAQVRINGRDAGQLLFGDRIGCSGLVRTGENTIEAVLKIGNRNLFGPHHFSLADDPTCVDPGMFELSGLWENGKSTYFLERYALVKNGLF